MNEFNHQKYEILKLLNTQSEPIGSGQLCRLLNQRGVDISEATVGRILSEMDRKSYTIKQGYRGRVINEEGKRALQQMENLKRQNKVGSRFVNIINSNNKKDILDILVARRAIERELARLAAIKATENEIRQMKEVLQEQEYLYAQNKMTAEQDFRFHKLVENAAKNNVLAAALDVIRHGEQLSHALEFIRNEVKGTLAIEHAKILREIINRDPEQAEKAMVEHIESLISDVEKFWERNQKSKNL